jgi:hypothetical protein
MFLFGCAYGDPDSKYPDLRRPGQQTPAYEEQPSIFGPGGLSIGNAKPETQDQGGGGGGHAWVLSDLKSLLETGERMAPFGD